MGVCHDEGGMEGWKRQEKRMQASPEQGWEFHLVHPKEME